MRLYIKVNFKNLTIHQRVQLIVKMVVVHFSKTVLHCSLLCYILEDDKSKEWTEVLGAACQEQNLYIVVQNVLFCHEPRAVSTHHFYCLYSPVTNMLQLALCIETKSFLCHTCRKNRHNT